MDSSRSFAAELLFAVLLCLLQVGLPVLGWQNSFWFGVLVWLCFFAVGSHLLWRLLSGISLKLRAGQKIGAVLVFAVALSVLVFPGLTRSYKSEHRQIAAASKAWLEAIAEQNRLAEAQLQPLFRFVKSRCTVCQAPADSLQVWNDGAPIDNLDIWEGSYIAVTRLLSPAEIRFVPSYYFRCRNYNGDAKAGLLVTFGAWDCSGYIAPVNLTKEYERLEAEARELNLVIQKRVFLRIAYTDHAAQGHHEVFDIYPQRNEYNRDAPFRAEDELGLEMNIDQDLTLLHGADLLRLWDTGAALKELYVLKKHAN